MSKHLRPVGCARSLHAGERKQVIQKLTNARQGCVGCSKSSWCFPVAEEDIEGLVRRCSLERKSEKLASSLLEKRRWGGYWRENAQFEKKQSSWQENRKHKLDAGSSLWLVLGYRGRPRPRGGGESGHRKGKYSRK